MPSHYPDRQGIYDFSFTKVVSGDSTYFTAHTFPFQGTDALGAPKAIKAIAGWIDNTTQSVRVYDVTNNQVICERTDITNEYPSIEDLGALSNLPSDLSIFEVQLKRPSGGPAKETAVASLYMEFG